MTRPVNIEDAIRNGYNFQFGRYLQRGLNKSLGDFWLYVGYTILMFVVFLIGGFLSGMVGLLFEAISGFWGKAFAVLIRDIVSYSLIATMIAGYGAAAYKEDQGEFTEFNDAFSGFYRFGEMFATGALMALILFLVTLPGKYLLYDQSGIPDPEIKNLMNNLPDEFNPVLIAVGLAIIYIPKILLLAAWVYVPFLVYFYNMSGMNALETSRQLVSKNALLVLFFIFVLGILTTTGFIILCIGSIFALDISCISLYEAFADTVKLNAEQPDETDIMDHFSPG